MSTKNSTFKKYVAGLRDILPSDVTSGTTVDPVAGTWYWKKVGKLYFDIQFSNTTKGFARDGSANVSDHFASLFGATVAASYSCNFYNGSIYNFNGGSWTYSDTIHDGGFPTAVTAILFN